MSKMVWDWGGGTFCQVHGIGLGGGGYVCVLLGRAVLFVDGDRAMYVGYGYNPKDVRLFRGSPSYGPTRTGVIIGKGGEVDHVLTLQEFARVVSAWEYAKGHASLPTHPEDFKKVQKGIPIGDGVIEAARKYFYHV